jgi:hypothetical protein
MAANEAKGKPMSSTHTKIRSPELVYHYTDTIRLPWIIVSGELQPSNNRIGGYPRDLLWATTNANGDRTSSAMSPSGLGLWRDGICELIRFSLHAKDFESFSHVICNCPEWTADQIARLESSAAAMGETDTSRWRCRSEPLPLTKALRVEAKSLAAGRWVEIDASPGRCIASSKYPDTRGVVIGQYWYAATRQFTSDGNIVYERIARHHFSPSAAE